MKFLILSVGLLTNAFGSDCYLATTYMNFKQQIKGSPSYFLNKAKTCALVDAIIEQESNFNPKAFNPEKTGSYGLMQIQCATAQRLGHIGSCKELFKPHVNILYGLQLLLHLEKRYAHMGDIIAAYNAGRVIKRDGQYINAHYVKSVYSKYLKRLPKNYVGVYDGVL